MLDFPDYNQALRLLKQYWGYSDFRDQQWAIIRSILEKKDCLGIMTTGGGKSLCYQLLPIYADKVLHKRSICLVISPLLALMNEQVNSFNYLISPKLGWRATYLAEEQNELNLWNELAQGQIRLVYLSPERISNPYYLERLQALTLDYICLDEAHCVMTWGQDFRPSYLNLISLKDFFPKATLLALSATVPVKNWQQLTLSLGLRNPRIYEGKFQKTNLSFSVYKCNNDEDKREKIVKLLSQFGRPKELNIPSGIIYARSRKRVEELTKELKAMGFPVEAYHAGLPNDIRKFRQTQWLYGRGNPPLQVLVSTNALGMGINKADIRLVIHDSPPSNLLNYYQEAGRAGRDRQYAEAIMLYSTKDLRVLEYFFENKLPSLEKINHTYEEILKYLEINPYSNIQHNYSFNLEEFSHSSELYCQENAENRTRLIMRNLYVLEKMQLLKRTKHISNFCYIKLRPYDNEFLIQQTLDYPLLEETMEQILRKFPPDTNPLGTLIPLDKLATSVKSNYEQVYLALQELHNRNLLDLHQSTVPRMWLEIAAPKSNNLLKDPNIRKQLEAIKNEIKMEASDSYFLDYIKNPPPCRSAYLTQYFSNTPALKCGICDQCMRKI